MSTSNQSNAPTATPVSAVDTNNLSPSNIFLLTIGDDKLSDGNLIQVEYLITDGAALQTSSYSVNDFISLDQIRTFKPSNSSDTDIYLEVPVSVDADNSYSESYIRFRMYNGTTDPLNSLIEVTDWSNEVPYKSPPIQPSEPTAYLVRNDPAYNTYYDDKLYVKIPPNSDSPYQIDTSNNDPLNSIVKFIVSYNYKDNNGVVKWVVSSPLNATLSNGMLSLDPITLAQDVYWSNDSAASVINVAVNAVLEYSYNSKNYYTVSEISNTVPATTPTPSDESPADLSIEYKVYDANSEQKMVLTWKPSNVSDIPNYVVDSYIVEVYVNNTLDKTVEHTDLALLEYEYAVPDDYINTTTSNAIEFKVYEVSSLHGLSSAATASKNTFTYATVPQALDVVWAFVDDTNNTKEDLFIEFKNPENNGQGAPHDFVINVYDSSDNVKHTKTHDYDTDTQLNLVYFHDITRGGSYVTVLLRTKDTNSDDLENGHAAGNQTYTASERPVFLSSSIENDELRVVIASPIAIVRKNELHSLDSPFKSVVFDSPTVVGDNLYTAGYQANLTDTEGVHTYTYIFTKQFLNDASISLTNPILVTTANRSGVRNQIVSPP